MAKLGNGIEKNIDESVFREKHKDMSALKDYGCFTLVQCAILAVLANVRGYLEEKHGEAAKHYLILAHLDITEGRLNAKHPLTHLPYSEYVRISRAGKLGFDESGIPPGDWLIQLDDFYLWLQSKGVHLDLDEFRWKIGYSSDNLNAIPQAVEALSESASSVHDWQSQARVIADDYFDKDTSLGCRRSLIGYSELTMEEMQVRGVKGPRGIIDNPRTIMRAALQGEKWWANKKK